MLKQFFIFCSGADPEVLENCPRSETIKQICIGGTVFFTGIFAFVAASYAMYRVFYNGPEDNSPLYLGLAIGLGWGFMIFNLDRYIVSSMTKTGTLKQQMYMAVPRFLIAVLISFVIAKPLEVKIFEDRIAGEIFDQKLDRQEKDLDRILRITGKNRIDGDKVAADNNVADLEARLKTDPNTPAFNTALEKYNSTNASYLKIWRKNKTPIAEAKKEINFIKNPNTKKYRSFSYVGEEVEENKIWKLSPEGERLLASNESQKERLDNENKAAWGKMNTRKKRLAELRKQHRESIGVELDKEQKRALALAEEKVEADKSTKEQKAESTTAADLAYSNTFITQIEGLGYLTRYRDDVVDESGTVIEEASNTLYWMNIAIVLLFVLIETSPVIVKLLSPKGEYDERLVINQTYNISTLKQDTQTRSQLNQANNAHVLQVDLSSNQQLLDTITKAQVEIAENIVDNWKEAELQNVRQNKPAIVPQQVPTTI